MEIQDNFVRHICKVEKVIDGDTMTAIVEMGYNHVDRITFRLTGINTAEMKSKKGTPRLKLAQEAKTYVEMIVDKYKTRVHSEKFKDGAFGRYQGVMYYYRDEMWVNLNEELLKLGLAQVYFEGASKDFGEFK